MIAVLLADDQALVREGFRLILEMEPDMEVVGEACDGREAVEAARRLKPDVVIMDIRMPGMDGIDAASHIVKEPSSAKVLMLTTFDRSEYIYRAMKAGASGFLLKDVRRGQLTEAVRTVAAGDALLAPAITRRLIEEFCRRPSPASGTPLALSHLTDRETEVLTLIARGLSNAEIATALVVNETTVKTHVAHILAKLHLRDRVQAVVIAYETGLAQPGAKRTWPQPGVAQPGIPGDSKP